MKTLWCENPKIPSELGKCHGWWCHGSLCRQDISNHCIDYVRWWIIVFHVEGFNSNDHIRCEKCHSIQIYFDVPLNKFTTKCLMLLRLGLVASHSRPSSQWTRFNVGFDWIISPEKVNFYTICIAQDKAIKCLSMLHIFRDNDHSPIAIYAWLIYDCECAWLTCMRWVGVAKLCARAEWAWLRYQSGTIRMWLAALCRITFVSKLPCK